MEHTKKFILVDPRFARPTMQDKVLSGLDNDISNILNSDDSDEIKVNNYISALSRFKNISTPQKRQHATSQPSQPAQIPDVTLKASSPLKRKRVKVETSQTNPSFDQPLWRRTQRAQTKKKFGPQWVEYSISPTKKKKKQHKNWIEQ